MRMLVVAGLLVAALLFATSSVGAVPLGGEIITNEEGDGTGSTESLSVTISYTSPHIQFKWRKVDDEYRWVKLNSIDYSVITVTNDQDALVGSLNVKLESTDAVNTSESFVIATTMSDSPESVGETQVVTITELVNGDSNTVYLHYLIGEKPPRTFDETITLTSTITVTIEPAEGA